MKSEKNLFWTD